MRMPNRDLCADLRVEPDDLGSQDLCTATNRHLRLYVAAWMLRDECGTDRAAVDAALHLYEGCGQDLLPRLGKLTTAGIAAEVVMMRAHATRRETGT